MSSFSSSIVRPIILALANMARRILYWDTQRVALGEIDFCARLCRALLRMSFSCLYRFARSNSLNGFCS